MRSLIIVLSFLLFVGGINAQNKVENLGEIVGQLRAFNEGKDKNSLHYARLLSDIDLQSEFPSNELGLLYFHIGMSYKYGAVYDTAYLFWSKALEHAQTNDNVSLKNKSLNELASAETQKRNAVRLSEYAKKLYKSAKSANNSEFIMKANLHMANMHEFSGSYDSALIFSARAKGQAVRQKDWPFYNRLLIGESTLLLKLNKITQALIELDSSIAYYQSINDAGSVADAKFNKASVLIKFGKTKESINLYFEVLPIYKEQKFGGRYPGLLANIGIRYAAIERNDEARKYYLMALDNFDGNLSAQAMIYSLLGGLSKEDGNFDEARALSHKSIFIAKKYGIPRRLAAAYHELGLVFIEMRNKENELYVQDSIIFYLEKALAEYRGANNLWGVVRVLTNLSAEILKVGDEHKAQDLILEALVTAETNELTDLIPIVYEKLSGLYRQRKDFENADHYRGKYIEATNFKQNEEVKTKLTNAKAYQAYLLKVGRDSLQHSHLLAGKSAEIEKRTKIMRLQNIIIAVVCTGVIIFIILLYRILKANKKIKQTVYVLKNTQNELVEKEKLAALGVLTKSMAHEINNPLQYIVGSAQTLQMLHAQTSNKDEVQTQLFNSINVGVERISKIIDNLTFLNWHSNKNDVSEIKESIQLSESLLKSELRKEITIKNSVKEPAYVKVGPSQLKAAIINVLRNAIESIKNKGMISISISNEASLCKVVIEDNGCGMSNEIISRANEPFFSTKEENFGVGLGLYTVQAIMKDCGGQLRLNSAVGKGTRVELWFKLASI